MHTPRTLAAALFSAAILLTTSFALADNDKSNGHHKGAATATSAQPTNAGEGQSHNSLTPSGGMGAPSQANSRSMDSPGQNQNGLSPMGKDKKNASDDTDRSAKSDRGFAQGLNGNSDDMVQNKVVIKLPNGQSAQFDVDSRMAATIKARGAHKALIFYSSDGKSVTSVSAIGERVHGHVVGTSGTAILFRTDDGQTRILNFGAAGAKLHLHRGSAISVETEDAAHARVISDDLLKKHAFDKFDKRATAALARKAKKSKSRDRDVAEVQDAAKHKCGESSGRRGGRAFANQMAKDAANDASGHNPPGLPHECVNPAGHTRGFCKSGSSSVDCSGSSSDTQNDVASADNGSGKTAKGRCGESAARNGRGRAFANQMAKDAANDASGHNPPGLPHECVNPAGHTRGFCKGKSSDVDCSSSGENDVASADTAGGTSKGKCGESASVRGRHGRAYANQMAKDAANDASGHNPPGLPHECINPAGHTRGWCKSSSTEADINCTSAVATQSAPSVANKPGTSPAVVGGGANAAPGPAVVGGGANAGVGPTVPGPHAINVPGFGTTPVGGGPGMVVGPPAGTGYVPARPRRAAAPRAIAAIPARANRPTRVMGAAIGPESIQLVPLSKTPCVWHRTAVMGAAVRPSRRVGRSYASGSHVHRHTNCQ